MNRQELIDAKLFHSVHTSERRAFRSCRRRWSWSYKDSYYPVITPQPLEFGTAYHAGYEVWYDPEMWNKDREVQAALAISKFTKVCNDQLKRYTELVGDPTPEVLDDYKQRVDLGAAMLEYYIKRVSPKLDKGLKPLAVEIPFEVDLGLNCKCDACWKLYNDWWDELCPNGIPNIDRGIVRGGRQFRTSWLGLPVTFGGTIDAIFEDSEGRILVADWKTTSKLFEEDELSYLDLDDQVGGYPAALYKLGHRVDGFFYHEQVKAVPGAPTLLTRKYKGKIFSTAKDAPVEYQTFLATVSKEDPEGYQSGAYDEYLIYLMGPLAPKFYQRTIVIKTETQMDNFWNDLIAEAQDMIGQPRVYPQPSKFLCKWCAYRQPCEGKNRGEDYLYTLNSMFTNGRP